MTDKLRLEWRDAKDLTDNPANWRRHPSSQARALQDIISEVGWAGALLYNEQTGRLIDGHLRKKVSKGKVPVLIGSWSEADERKILATLDPIANMAQADGDALMALLRQVETGSQAVKDLLEALANGENLPLLEPKGGLIPDDEIPEASEPICKTGDLWQLGEHRLLCGDATKKEDVGRLMGGEKADMVFTDPPYGIDMAPASIARKLPKLRNDNLKGTAFRDFLQRAFDCFLSFNKGDTYICNDWRSYPVFADIMVMAGCPIRCLIVWNKQNPAQNLNKFAFVHEFIAYSGFMGPPTLDTNVWDVKRELSDKHLTVKPVELIIRALSASTQSDGIVMDVFGGSGSTLIACEKLGRKCYMMEIEPHYCDVIIERWQKFTGQKAVKLG